nr:hypothetical protein [uncultured Caldimonas sp.]
MFYALSWFVVITLLALWSITAWVLHAVTIWTLTNAPALSGATSAIEAVRLPDWLAPWLPTEVAQALASTLAGLGPVIESMLQAVPALAGGVTVAAWVIWALGSVVLVLLGVGVHLLIAMWRRHRRSAQAPSGATRSAMAR